MVPLRNATAPRWLAQHGGGGAGAGLVHYGMYGIIMTLSLNLQGFWESCELLKGRYGLKVREMLKHIVDFLGTGPH